MLFRLALTLFFATNASAFFVTPNGVARPPFVSLQVSLSDSSTNTEIPLSSEDADKPAAEEKAAVESVEVVATDDAAADESDKPSRNTERHTLYVGNLPFSATLGDVRSMFAEKVDVRYVSLPKNKETGVIKGFAFVDVGSPEDIPKAVDAFDGIELEGRPMRVSLSLPKEQVQSTKKNFGEGSQKLYVGNISFATTKDELRDYVSKHGEVIDVFTPVNNYGEPRGFGFVTVKKEDADGVIEALNGVEFMGRNLVVNVPLPPGEKSKRGPQSRRVKLFVGNLSFFTSSDTLIEVFEEFGEVYDCYIPQDSSNGNSRGFGFITMLKDVADSAINALDGCELDGRPITVNEAKPRGAKGEEDEEDENSEEADAESP